MKRGGIITKDLRREVSFPVSWLLRQHHIHMRRRSRSRTRRRNCLGQAHSIARLSRLTRTGGQQLSWTLKVGRRGMRGGVVLVLHFYLGLVVLSVVIGGRPRGTVEQADH